MLVVLSILALAAGAAGEPASTPQTASSAQPVVAAPAPAQKGSAVVPSRRVCKTQPALGSMLKKTRVCRTVAEWAVVNGEDRRALQKMQVGRRFPDGG